MTEKEKFVAYLQKQGFKMYDGILMGSLDFGVPHHRVSNDGTHTLITAIKIVNFDGCGTAKGDLGCVTYYYSGTQRRRGRRCAETQAEILKRAECPKLADSAIKVYEQWRAETNKNIESWKVIL